jgi:carboxypeptidase Taq
VLALALSLVRIEAHDVAPATFAVADLPAAWNAKMQSYLGLTPPTDREGCLQDIHWAMGAIGYFPTYALGSLMSVQLFEAAKKELGDVEAQLAEGDFGPLLAWLREKVHRHGRALSASEIMRRATDDDLRSEPWLEYATAKFGAIYGLSGALR